MDKKRICIVCVIIMFGIMSRYLFFFFSEEDIPMEPDVVSSISVDREQYLTVVANRDKIEDKEEFAELLVQMCRENSFHTIKFSTDRGYSTGLHMRVYLHEEDIEKGNVVMEIDYVQKECDGQYDIYNNPEKFELYVDVGGTN